MAKLAKKIKINQVLNMDRQKMKSGEISKDAKPLTVKMIRAAAHVDKQTDYIPKENLDRIISVARAHALWLHMDVLKQVFNFTSKQLLIFHAKLKDVLTRITPLELPKAVPVKRRALLKAAQTNLEQTAKVLNFLIDIHLLT